MQKCTIMIRSPRTSTRIIQLPCVVYFEIQSVQLSTAKISSHQKCQPRNRLTHKNCIFRYIWVRNYSFTFYNSVTVRTWISLFKVVFKSLSKVLQTENNCWINGFIFQLNKDTISIKVYLAINFYHNSISEKFAFLYYFEIATECLLKYGGQSMLVI